MTISEKIVRRIIGEESLVVRAKRRRKYNSYQGDVSPAVPAGKVYRSPIVDCFDGMIPTWSIGESPDANLVNNMLGKAIGTLESDETPMVHSDCGCHYRWFGWIKYNEIFYNRDWSRGSMVFSAIPCSFIGSITQCYATVET